MKAAAGRRTLVILIAAAALAFVWWHWPHWRHRATMAAGFGARIACSCRFVEGRSMASCRTDFARLKGMGLVTLSDRPDAAIVDAGVPFLARRSARAVPGFGCLVDPPRE